MDEIVFMRLSRPLTKLLTKVYEEKYAEYLIKENGKPIMQVRLKKALYGTLQAALDLSRQPERWKFELNPKNNCVANKTIDRSQCIILWHMDDLKISHIKP